MRIKRPSRTQLKKKFRGENKHMFYPKYQFVEELGRWTWR